MDTTAVVELLDPRTPARLALARHPSALADYYRYGAEYVRDVADAMGFEGAAIDATIERATTAMAANRTDVPPAVARSIAAVVLGDANWWLPLGTWVPLRWAALSGFRAWPLFVNLRRVGNRYAAALETFEVPTFSTRWDVFVAGKPAVEHVSGYTERLVLADSLLHLEWFVAVADDHGVTVPDGLVEQTRRESLLYFTGHRDDLSPAVKEFQYHLFADGEWIRRFAERYTGITTIDERGMAAIERTRRTDLS